MQLSENPVRGKQLPSLKLPAPMHTRRPPSRGRGRLHDTAESVVRQPHRHPCVVSLDGPSTVLDSNFQWDQSGPRVGLGYKEGKQLAGGCRAA